MEIKPFSQLWEDAEKLVSRLHKNTSTSEILKLITSLLNDYKDMDLSDINSDVKKSIKNRYIGEILFLLTYLSSKDGINVYASLMEEISLNSSQAITDH